MPHVSAGLLCAPNYNDMNIVTIGGSQIYQAKDAPGMLSIWPPFPVHYSSTLLPDFRTGNTINIAFAGAALVLWFVQKYAYRFVNARRERIWLSLSDQERAEELKRAEHSGNRALTFRFTN
jgi:hypothetical protein